MLFQTRNLGRLPPQICSVGGGALNIGSNVVSEWLHLRTQCAGVAVNGGDVRGLGVVVLLQVVDIPIHGIDVISAILPIGESDSGEAD